MTAEERVIINELFKHYEKCEKEYQQELETNEVEETSFKDGKRHGAFQAYDIILKYIRERLENE